MGHENHTPETEEYGISSFVYKRTLPFNAKRFDDFLQEMPENIVRAKGLAWLASRNDFAIMVSQAGRSVGIEPVSYWVAAMPTETRRQILAENREMEIGRASCREREREWGVARCGREAE